MNRAIGILMLLMKERFCREAMARRPEPTSEMNDPENVEAFHAQGSHTGPLLPVYHFNALGISRLAPEGGTVLDLGSGSGQFLAYLAKLRPDLKIRGLDLAPAMIARGNRFLAEEGLSDRVRLEVGDMTSFADQLEERVDVISSIFSLHHLPSIELLRTCVGEIGKIVGRDKCHIWIFDHARPRCKRTAQLFPEVFTPTSPAVFKADSCNSLIAAYSLKEISGVMNQEHLSNINHHLAKPLSLYQIHCSEFAETAGQRDFQTFEPLPHPAQASLDGLSRLFPQLPIKSGEC